MLDHHLYEEVDNAGVRIPSVEVRITLSMVFLGLAIALGACRSSPLWRLSLPLLYHDYAHGEIPDRVSGPDQSSHTRMHEHAFVPRLGHTAGLQLPTA
jgi:hydrogenase/urease accessory protein HupE